jgi:hypothetical protein
VRLIRKSAHLTSGHFGPKFVTVLLIVYHKLGFLSISLSLLPPLWDRAFRQFGLLRDTGKPPFFFLCQAAVFQQKEKARLPWL